MEFLVPVLVSAFRWSGNTGLGTGVAHAQSASATNSDREVEKVLVYASVGLALLPVGFRVADPT